MGSKLKYLLLDLDGTLIQFNLDAFIQGYLRLIQKQFSHYSFAKFVPEWILKGTELMLSNEGTMTNKDKFLQYFGRQTGLSEAEIWENFIHFYHNDYEQIKRITKPAKGARRFLEQAVSKGFKLVIATQPVFPEIAIKKRLLWAGVADLPIQLITHIENMFASKPYPQYFEQILSMLGALNDECLMVGNDQDMDLASENVGISSFYLMQDAGENIPPNQKLYGDFDNLGTLLDIF